MNDELFHQLYEYLIDYHVCLLIDPSKNGIGESYKEQLQSDGFLIINLDFDADLNNPAIRDFRTGYNGWYTTFFNLIKNKIKSTNRVSKDQEGRIRQLLHPPSDNPFTKFYNILEEIAQDNKRSLILLNLTAIHDLENPQSSLSEDDISLFLEAVNNYIIKNGDNDKIYFLLESIKNIELFDSYLKKVVISLVDQNQEEPTLEVSSDQKNNKNNKNSSKDKTTKTGKKLIKILDKIPPEWSWLSLIKFLLENIGSIFNLIKSFREPLQKIIESFAKHKKFWLFVLLFSLAMFLVFSFGLLFSGSPKLIDCYRVDNRDTLSLFKSDQQLKAMDSTLKKSEILNKCSNQKFIFFKNIQTLKKTNDFILQFIYNHIFEKNEFSKKDGLIEFSEFDAIAVSDNAKFFAGSGTTGNANNNTPTERSRLVLWNEIGQIQDRTDPQIEIKDLEFWKNCLISGGRSEIKIWDINQNTLDLKDTIKIEGIINIDKIKPHQASDVDSTYFLALYNGLIKGWKLNSQCNISNEAGEKDQSIFRINDENDQILDMDFIKEDSQYVDIVTFSKKGYIKIWRWNKSSKKLDTIYQQEFISDKTETYSILHDLNMNNKYLYLAVNSPQSNIYQIQLWSWSFNERGEYTFKREDKSYSHTQPIQKMMINWKDSDEGKILFLDRDNFYIQDIFVVSNNQFGFSRYSASEYKDFEIIPSTNKLVLAGSFVKILYQSSDKKRGFDYSPVTLESGIHQIKTRNLDHPNNNESGTSTILVQDEANNFYSYELSLNPQDENRNIKDIDYSNDGLRILKLNSNDIRLFDPNNKDAGNKPIPASNLDQAVFYPPEISSVIATLSSSQSSINFIDVDSSNSMGSINTNNIGKSIQFDFDNNGKYLGLIYNNQPYSDFELVIWKIEEEANKIRSPFRLQNSVEAKAFAFYFSNNDRNIFIIDREGSLILYKIIENQQGLTLDPIEFEFKVFLDLNSQYELEQGWEKIMILSDGRLVLAKTGIIAVFEPSQTKPYQWNLSYLFEGDWTNIGDIEFINKPNDEEIILGDTQGLLYKLSLYETDEITTKSCEWLDDYYKSNTMPQMCLP